MKVYTLHIKVTDGAGTVCGEKQELIPEPTRPGEVGVRECAACWIGVRDYGRTHTESE